MASAQGPVIFSAVSAKQPRDCAVSVAGPFVNSRFDGSGLWGYKKVELKNKVKVTSYVRKSITPRCSLSSSSGGQGRIDNFYGNSDDYVESSIVEAVEVTSGASGFLIKMRDGINLRCAHNNPQAAHVSDYAPHPAIVLKMEDATGLLLPIIVSELPSMLLMAAVRNVQIPRPTMYQVIQDMIDKMGYTAKLVRVTKRVHEAYFAELHLSRTGNNSDCISFDLRPSDAINIAVRCKVPIQVNKHLVYNDGVKVIESAKSIPQSPASDGFLFTRLDKPSGQPCSETEEFDLLRNMLIAADEERYKDAAEWRNKLTQFRSKRNWT
uniref:BFN domain-containing protein n=1 Tax=Kalanchoe fedtschenkoi TaxID=63787 RepID=A0A7N0TZR2_KALFE